MPWLRMLYMVLQAFLGAFTQIDYLLVMGVVLMLVHGQYSRLAAMEQQTFGAKLTKPGRQTAVATLYGLFGGAVATAIFIVLGFSLTDAGIWYLWPLALVLMMVQKRFLCFAYAGGLVGLSHLIFGWPQVHVPSLMALIAALHFVESLLMRLHGADDASPVYAPAADGSVVGGFVLVKFWPLAVVALAAISGADLPAATAGLEMPDWWPLLRGPNALGNASAVYSLFPVVVALGYSDMALARMPEEKAKLSSQRLMAFSLILLTLAILSDHLHWLALAAVLFSPIGHDLVIHLGQREELSGSPLFVSQGHPMVLAVVLNSPAETMGLRRGDVIRKVNGYSVYSRMDVSDAVSPWALDVVIQVDRRLAGEGLTVVRFAGRVPPLGIIFAPEDR